MWSDIIIDVNLDGKWTEEQKKRFNKIDKYFKNITIEEFEEQLERAGIDEIRSCKEDGYEL